MGAASDDAMSISLNSNSAQLEAAQTQTSPLSDDDGLSHPLSTSSGCHHYSLYLVSHASPHLHLFHMPAPSTSCSPDVHQHLERKVPALPVAVHLVPPYPGVDTDTSSGAGIQRIVGGRIKIHVDPIEQPYNRASVFVLALARKDATIDIVVPLPADVRVNGESVASPTSTPSHGPTALRVATLREDRMRVGMERWVGLALSDGALYSCSSAGHFRSTPFRLLFSPDSGATHASSASFRCEVGVSDLALSLPAPLQHCAFHPLQDPKYFAYGGEEVPLSLWSIPEALHATKQADSGPKARQGTAEVVDVRDDGTPLDTTRSDGAHAATTHQGDESRWPDMTARQRKRKRIAETRSRARELLPGEIWRAKNRPNITSIAFLPARSPPSPSNGSPGDDVTGVAAPRPTPPSPSTSPSQDPDADSALPSLRLATGTRDGKLRVYEPYTGVRKARLEADLADRAKGGVKLVESVAPQWHPQLLRGRVAASASAAAGKSVGHGGARPPPPTSRPTPVETHEGGRDAAAGASATPAVDEVVFADGAGRLGVFDLDEAKIRYTFREITGAITCLLPLPAPAPRLSERRAMMRRSGTGAAQGEAPDDGCRDDAHGGGGWAAAGAPEAPPYLASGCLDSLVRLHALGEAGRLPRSSRTPVPARATGRHESHRRGAGKTLVAALSGTPAGVGLVSVTGMAWDGERPVVAWDDDEERADDGAGRRGGSRVSTDRGAASAHLEGDAASSDDGEGGEEMEGDDAMWDGMGTVGAAEAGSRRGGGIGSGGTGRAPNRTYEAGAGGEDDDESSDDDGTIRRGNAPAAMATHTQRGGGSNGHKRRKATAA